MDNDKFVEFYKDFKINVSMLDRETEKKLEYAEYLFSDLYQIIDDHKQPSESKVTRAMIYQESSRQGMEPDFKISYKKDSYKEFFKMDFCYFGERIIFSRSNKFENVVLSLDNMDFKKTFMEFAQKRYK